MQVELGEMHWSDGLLFTRLDDGRVRIRKVYDDTGGSEIVEHADASTIIAVIPPNEWASIILHVADHGSDTNRVTIEDAMRFHGVP